MIYTVKIYVWNISFYTEITFSNKIFRTSTLKTHSFSVKQTKSLINLQQSFTSFFTMSILFYLDFSTPFVFF